MRGRRWTWGTRKRAGVNRVAMPHLDSGTLETRLRALPAVPRDVGRVERVVQRLPGEQRVCPGVITLDIDQGVRGDRWALGKSPSVAAQVTVMRADVASVLCDGDDYAILGDNLFVTLETSAEALPPGTRLAVGGATCEVTEKPHTGCSKFSARVGQDAWMLSRHPDWLPAQLRGVHLRVLQGGEVRDGDTILVESRP